MTSQDEIRAMCAEINEVIGRQKRKRGWVTVGEFAENTGLSRSAAAYQLQMAADGGELLHEKVFLNGRWQNVYRKVGGACQE